jgi:hypothetical protein
MDGFAVLVTRKTQQLRGNLICRLSYCLRHVSVMSQDVQMKKRRKPRDGDGPDYIPVVSSSQGVGSMSWAVGRSTADLLLSPGVGLATASVM